MAEFFATGNGGFNLEQVVDWKRTAKVTAVSAGEKAYLSVGVQLSTGYVVELVEDEARRFLARVERQQFHDALVRLYDELKRWIDNGELLLEPGTMRLFREAQEATSD